MKNQFLLGLFVSFIVVAGCGKSDSGTGIPLIEPPVTKVTPASLKLAVSAINTSRSLTQFALNTDEIKSRFFSASPTEIKWLLQSVDTRLKEINTRSAESQKTCLSATPVQQTIAVAGANQTAYFQCYDVFSDNSGGMLFGKKENTWYIYENVGAMRSFAHVTPVAGTTEDYVVEAWFSVGQNNTSGCSTTWFGCSYGVIHLKANSSTNALEMTVAGTGFGYCGAHLRSDGTNLYIVGSSGGSTDGSAWSCGASDNSCTLAASLSQAGSCAAISSNFDVTTLGVTGQSTVGTGIVLNGTATDSVHFGYEVTALSTISGVAKFE